jgi:hypothetical protein
LVEIKELLRIRYDNETQASSRIADPIANKSDNIAQSMGFTRPLSTATLQGDRQKGFQIAPVATIRQFCESITGPAGAADSNAIFDDFLAIKADLEPIERQLLERYPLLRVAISLVVVSYNTPHTYS